MVEEQKDTLKRNDLHCLILLEKLLIAVLKMASVLPDAWNGHYIGVGKIGEGMLKFIL